MALRKLNYTSEADYLEFERNSDMKHEYLNGEIFAMSGATEAHNLICFNLGGTLYTQLRGKPCKAYPLDMRVHIPATGLYTYPDVSIVCEKPQFIEEAFDTLLNPTVLIEVLSPSTEGYDRGEKFRHYRTIPSLREYLLVSQVQAHIDHYVLDAHNEWKLRDAFGLEASLELPAIGCRLQLADVYEKVTFPSDDEENNL